MSFSLCLGVAFCLLDLWWRLIGRPIRRLYRLETKPIRRVKATLTTTVDAPHLAAHGVDRVGTAVPELPSQRDVVQSLSVANTITRESSPLKREIFSARVATAGSQRGKHRLSLTAEYHATLHSRRLVALGSPARLDEPPADDEDRSRYLRSDRFVDYEHRALQHWLAKRGLKNSTGIRSRLHAKCFARYARTLNTRSASRCQRGVSRRCQRGAADCGGLSMIFAAAMRANGIPARLSGRTLGRVSAWHRRQIADQMHVKAEFYADGVGWIPVDCSGAVEDRAAAESDFFGSDAGDFLTFHVDCGMQVDTVHFGVEELVTLQDVAFWAKGDGSFQGITTSSDWRVTDEPLIDALAKHP